MYFPYGIVPVSKNLNSIRIIVSEKAIRYVYLPYIIPIPLPVFYFLRTCYDRFIFYFGAVYDPLFRCSGVNRVYSFSVYTRSDNDLIPRLRKL